MNNKKNTFNFLQRISLNIMGITSAFILINLLFSFIMPSNANNTFTEPAVLEEHTVISMTYNETTKCIDVEYKTAKSDEIKTTRFINYTLESIDNSVIRVYDNGNNELVVSLLK